MSLDTSINSDLPGQITARVTEDVYDSVSGCRMLIPAMAKVVGMYDSRISLGQSRMLVAWNTLIFPDGGELNLAGIQAYDTSGQAGLQSDVDNHYWRMFGLTFGLSMITTGVQLSIPQPNPTSGGGAAAQTPAQILATSLAQQYGTLGAQIISRYMAVQPTLRNFAGERFIVMVPRSIVFPKVWRDRCVSGSKL
jgi:type IV secretion system protein VirB10